MKHFITLFMVLLVPLPTVAAADPVAKKTNVVFFLVDDMGWMDSGVYGSKYYETPNIDQLAKRSMLFTNAYAQPLCSPRRASLLTGQYSTTSAKPPTSPQNCPTKSSNSTTSLMAFSKTLAQLLPAPIPTTSQPKRQPDVVQRLKLTN